MSSFCARLRSSFGAHDFCRSRISWRDRQTWRAPFEVGPTLPDLVERLSGLRLGEEEDATGDFGQP